MTTVIGRNFKVEGTLCGFEDGSEEVVFKFEGGYSVEILKPGKEMLMSLQSIGLARLTTATIDFTKGSVILGKKVEKITRPQRRIVN